MKFGKIGAAAIAAAIMASTAAIVAYADVTIEDNVIVIPKADILDAEKIVITYSVDADSAEKLGAAISPDWAWKEYEFTLPAGKNATFELAIADVLKGVGAKSTDELGDLTKIYNAGGEATFEKAEIIAAEKAEETTAEETKAEEKAEDAENEEEVTEAEKDEPKDGDIVLDAPAPETTAAETTTAAAAGDVSAATNSSKGSPDTGIVDVAAVAGLALAAAGAVVLAKKRK